MRIFIKFHNLAEFLKIFVLSGFLFLYYLEIFEYILTESKELY